MNHSSLKIPLPSFTGQGNKPNIANKLLLELLEIQLAHIYNSEDTNPAGLQVKVAMPSIGTSPSETNCYKCLVELQTEALKCARCNSHMHLRCSELPLYMLLRFKTSQSQYICQSCVLGEGSPEALKEAEENLIENMELEKAAIEEAAKVADDSINVVPEVADDKGPGKIRAPVKNKAVCKYYLMRECQHGRLGKTCNFSHPKICVKFSKNGDRRGGCIKGKTCKDYHPQLCFESQDKHECSKRKCRFFHLNGTKKLSIIPL